MSVQEMAPVRTPKSHLDVKAQAAQIEEARRRMRGFFARLTPEQEREVLAYRGDDTVLDPLADSERTGAKR